MICCESKSSNFELRTTSIILFNFEIMFFISSNVIEESSEDLLSITEEDCKCRKVCSSIHEEKVDHWELRFC